MALVVSCKGGEKKLEQVKPSKQPNKSLKISTPYNSLGENVHCGFMDKSGNLWFGTTGYGVFKYDGEGFTNYGVKDGLGDGWVKTIAEDNKGNVLLGTGSGLFVYDDGVIKPFLKVSAFANQEIKKLYLDKRGRLWIATGSKGVYIYDGQKLENLINNTNISNDLGLTLNGVSDITEDNRGNVWFTTWPPNVEGIVRYDGKNLIRSEATKGTNDSLFHCVITDKNGVLWFGSRNNGLFTYDGEDFAKLFTDEPLNSEAIYDVLEDSKGNIWFTTEANSVYRYDGENLTNFTTKDGLLNNSVFSVVEDSAGNLWFGARDVSLCRFDGESFVGFSE